MVCLQSLHSVGVVTILCCFYSDYAMPLIYSGYVILFCNPFGLIILMDFAYNITWLLCSVVFDI